MKKTLVFLPFFVLIFLNLSLSQKAFALDKENNGLVFSHESGFYNSVFTLKISAPENCPLLKYTIDGSQPSSSSSAKEVSDSVSIFINPSITSGRGKTPAFIVRVVYTNENGDYSYSVTKTYLFLDKVKSQQYPGGGWPGKDINNQMLDYALASDVATTAPYSFQMSDALKQIPTISVVTDLKNLFDSKKGIYVNSQKKGISWERPCSVELINPGGEEGFQINAGLRIRGGNSAKNKNNPKHGFRLFFREEYGASKLKFPLFGDEGADEFDCIDLRCEQNYSWSMDGSRYNTMIKDVFCRDLQREMAQPYKRGRQYHLYLNGMYWGIYQTDERAEASYAESYLGGEKEDYDIVKVNTQPWPYYIEATDGNLNAWEELWEYCKDGFKSNDDYFKLEGKTADGKPDSNGEVLVDIDNLIDYMLVIFYTGNFDAPVSGWHSNNMPNNFYGIFNRENKEQGFKFLVHDSEHSMFVESVYGFKGINENRVNLGTTGKMNIDDVLSFNPQWLHYKLCSNLEYRQRFANRAFKYLNNGIMSPENARKLFKSRADEIETAIIAESARWGDAQSYKSLTKMDDWLPEINRMYDEFFPRRTAIVIDQLKNVDLWPLGDAPQIVFESVDVTNQKIDFSGNAEVILLNPNTNGNLYYTLNGNNPRTVGGGINTDAIAIENGRSFVVATSFILKTQVKFNNEWGPVSTTTFRNINNNFEKLSVTELHYHPEDVIEGSDTVSGKDFEFIEFKNIGVSIIDLSGLSIDSGVTFNFPYNTILEPEAYYVVASKPNKFYAKYGFYPQGNFKQNLSNSGELIQLSDEKANVVISFTYNDKSPWPEEPDGGGYTLCSVENNPTGDPNEFEYWKASSIIDGTPFLNDDRTVSKQLSQMNSTKKLNIYPNPTVGIVIIELQGLEKNTLLNMMIYNSRGEFILTHDIVNGEQFDFRNHGLKPDFYLLYIYCENNIYSTKVIYLL